MALESSIFSTLEELIDERKGVTAVLEAIDQLLDAIEQFDAPITRELLRTAMMALVQECHLQDSQVTTVN